MYSPLPSFRSIPPRVFGVFMISILGLLLTGCMESYGRLQPSQVARHQLYQGNYPPQYRYYYYGPQYRPYAVLGLEPKYDLATRGWKTLDPASETLKEMVSNMETGLYYHDPLYGSHGAFILDPSGNQIGIWYSPWGHTTVKQEDDNRVAIYLPELHRHRYYRKDMLN